jgi:hypothetical protein
MAIQAISLCTCPHAAYGTRQLCIGSECQLNIPRQYNQVYLHQPESRCLGHLPAETELLTGLWYLYMTNMLLPTEVIQAFPARCIFQAKI